MVNRAFAESFGYRPEDFIGAGTLEMSTGNEEELRRFIETDRQVLETGERLEISVYPGTLPDGTLRISHSHKMPLKNDAGETVGVVGVLEDITQRVEAEQRLRESESQTRLMIDNLPVLITYMGSDQRFRYVNHTAEEWYGRPAAEIVGRTVAEIIASSATFKI